MAACIKLSTNFFIYVLSKEWTIAILNAGQMSVLRISNDPWNKYL